MYLIDFVIDKTQKMIYTIYARRRKMTKTYHGTVAESERTFGGFNWPSIARLSDGRLAVVSSGFRLAHVCPFGKITIQYSSDEGNSWTPPAVLLDSPLDDRDAGITVCGNDVIVTSFNNSRAFQSRLAKRDRTAGERTLIEAYLATVSDKEEEEYLGSTFVVSRDGGVSFGKIGHVSVSSPHGPAVLPDGSLFYLGKAFCMEDENGKFPIDKLQYVTSRDWEHWTEPKELALPNAEGYFFCEAHAVVLKSGRILAGLRGQGKSDFSVWIAYSDDGGKSFSKWKNLGFHGSPPHFMQHSSGAVILSYGYRKNPFGQRARISMDDGETWSEEIVLRSDGLDWDLGYPATAECSDGSLITVYYQKRPNARHTGIYYTKWSLSDI